MANSKSRGSERRKLIADAGMRIIARDGVRALTHRAVDREAQLSTGSASYYVPTRKALLTLIVQTLAERSMADAELASQAAAQPQDRWRTLDDLAVSITGLLTAYASRPIEMRTRYALLLELDADDPVRALLSQDSPVQQQMFVRVADALDGLGVAEATSHAAELFALTDALLAHLVITGNDASSVAGVVAAYLRGLKSSAG